MANTYKNIVITPNIGSTTDDPKIVFSGGNTSVNTDITMRVYPTVGGTLSFEGSAGQLFSITNDLTGSIFSVNDISGIPSIDVNANGNITLAQFSGNVGIGTATPNNKLDVTGNTRISGGLLVTQNNATQLDVIGEIAEFAHNIDNYAQVHVRNASAGTSASGDFIVTADVGTDTVDYIDLGINGSGYSQPTWTINGARDGYLYMQSQNLAIGVANTNRFISFFAGGTLSSNEIMRVTTSNVGIGRTDPGYKLDVVGTINATNVLINGAAITGSGGGALKFSSNVGNGVSNVFNISHNLNTTTIIPALRELATGYFVYPDMKYTSPNTIVLEFVTAPTANQYLLVVLGA